MSILVTIGKNETCLITNILLTSPILMSQTRILALSNRYSPKNL